jgi:DNA repair and recombination protein RAD52
MTFTLEITKELERKLDPSNVKQRKGGSNVMLDYLEAWYVIQEANRIFGHDGWSRETVRLEQVGEVHESKDNYGKPRYKVGYRATVRVTVGGIIREGTGFGNGTGPDPVDVHELAAKEAESDGMKRGFATFGNPFGLALYDKKRAGVLKEDDAPADKPLDELKSFLQTVVDAINSKETIAALEKFLSDNQAHMEELKKRYPNKYQNLSEKIIAPHRAKITGSTPAKGDKREGAENWLKDQIIMMGQSPSYEALMSFLHEDETAKKISAMQKHFPDLAERHSVVMQSRIDQFNATTAA